MSEWSNLKERVAGRWQLPLLVLSLVMLAGSFLRLRPSPAQLPLDEALEYLDVLVAGGVFNRAIELGETLLAREDCRGADCAPVHLRLARALYGAAEQRGARNKTAARRIIECYKRASSDRGMLAAADHVNYGQVLEWQRRYADALRHYEEALELGVDDPLDLRKRTLELALDRLEIPLEEIRAKLDLFLLETGDDRLDLALWAIERQLDVFEQMGNLEEATTLLTRNRDRFHQSDLRDRFAYLEAWLFYKTGHYDQAETYLRALRNRVEPGGEVSSMTGWLLGRVVMEDGGPQRPQEALSFFTSVINHRPWGKYAVASRIGSAEALMMLERHTEAIKAYRAAIEDLAELGDQHLVNRDVLRTSLSVAAEAQRQAGRLSNAVEYARLAAGLTDFENLEQAAPFLQQLGQIQYLLATELEEGFVREQGIEGQSIEAVSPRAREMFSQASSTFHRLARIAVLNERVAAEASWRAAELSARAGERERAVRLLREFASERPLHAFVPRALLRIGQIEQLSGHLTNAIEAYRECYRRFPRTLEGARTLVPMAQCYLALGSGYEDLAEKTLRVVLERSEVFTPEAPEFADALFLLGDALNRRGDFERAIATLEEALERYGDDPRVPGARYLLADSYRKSGLAIKAEIAGAKHEGQIKQLRSEALARLQAARKRYRDLITEYERRDPSGLSRIEKMYLRHARLYEADCFFEAQDYQRALELYEAAASAYKETESALAAYVQIINCYVFLNRPDEARAALARARVLLDALPEKVFARSISPEGREDWKRYFEWLSGSELL